MAVASGGQELEGSTPSAGRGHSLRVPFSSHSHIEASLARDVASSGPGTCVVTPVQAGPRPGSPNAVARKLPYSQSYPSLRWRIRVTLTWVWVSANTIR